MDKKEFKTPEIIEIPEQNMQELISDTVLPDTTNNVVTTVNTADATDATDTITKHTIPGNLGNRIVQFLQTHIKKPYYYVSPCPNCGSFVTGRYIRAHKGDSNEWAIDDALKNGEIVEPIPEMGSKNCFCLDCGYEWFDFVDMKWFSLDQIRKEKTLRHTREILTEHYNQQEEYKKTHKRNFLSRFIGKI